MIIALFVQCFASVLALFCLLMQAEAQTLDISWPKDGSVFQQD